MINKDQLVFQRLHFTVMNLYNWGYFPARNGENQVKERFLSNSCDKIILELFPELDNLLICCKWKRLWSNSCKRIYTVLLLLVEPPGALARFVIIHL